MNKQSPVMCNTCKKTYDQTYSDSQANHCATTVVIENGYKIAYGNYGSCHDTERLICHPNNKKIKTGIICDSCIDSFIDDKTLIIDTEYVWQFEP